MKTPQTTPLWRGLLLALLGAITWLALNPAPPQALDSGWDKLNHLAAFASLAVCAWRGWGPAATGPATWTRGMALAIGLLAYGLFIEVAQGFVPGRSGEAADLLADGIGIALGWALHHLLAGLQGRWAAARSVKNRA